VPQQVGQPEPHPFDAEVADAVVPVLLRLPHPLGVDHSLSRQVVLGFSVQFEHGRVLDPGAVRARHEVVHLVEHLT
jgi:hypothetical protein